jgi:hypothetical protein
MQQQLHALLLETKAGMPAPSGQLDLCTKHVLGQGRAAVPVQLCAALNQHTMVSAQRHLQLSGVLVLILAVFACRLLTWQAVAAPRAGYPATGDAPVMQVRPLGWAAMVMPWLSLR